jgi:superfamily II DNA or RNA helicase
MENESKDYFGFLSYERISTGPWQAFERAIARLLAHKGWDTYDVVGGTGDKGADVLASCEDEEKIFQVKFSLNNHPLSVNIVGDVKRAIEFYDIQNGVCVSNRRLGIQQKQKLKILREQGYKIEEFTASKILDAYNKLPVWPTEKRTMRRYQRFALDKILSSYLNQSKKGLVTLATGLGKTFIAGSFLREIFQINPILNVLVLADKKELLLQFDKSIWTCIPKTVATHILHESEKPAFNRGILLSTFQSFDGYYKNHQDIEFDIVIVDEAHHAPADTFKAVIAKINPKYLLGLTATPFRKDQRSVIEIFGEPLVKYDVITAMQMGYLANVDYRIKNDNLDTDWIAKESRKGYTIRQLNKKIFLPERDEKICDSIIEYWNFKKPKRGIVFCNSSLHAERIEKILRSSNFSARSLTTRVEKAEERAKRLRLFRKGEIKILTCYDMLNEGVDVPDVDFLVYLRVTHSRVVFLQQLGRGLRYKEGKTLMVFDYVADLRRLAEVRKFKDDFDEYSKGYRRKNDIEEIGLPSNFSLEFVDKSTGDFLNLVSKDASELIDKDEDDEIYLL